MTSIAAAGVAAVKGMLKQTHPIKAQWVRIDAPPLPRSSHSLSVIAGRAYIFGGEINSREPVDNDMHIITLPSGSSTSADYKRLPAKAEAADGAIPEKRVGHTAAVIGERIFIFGGRGGKEMKPLQENGRVWVFNTRTLAWSFLDPVPRTPYPEARSYHTSIAIEQPEHSNKKTVEVDNRLETPRPGKIAEGAQTEAKMGGHGTFFVHAGCPLSGRTNDLWGFDVRSRTWKEYPTAPGKPRGGTSLSVSKQRIYRYGGFNGVSEEGGQVDVLELGMDTFNDKGGIGEMSVMAKGKWETLSFAEEDMKFPGNRSVAGLQTISTGMGREYLILMLGERDPSNDGHNSAGTFWDDVWAFQSPPQGMTGASFKDATWQALGRETGEGLWSQVQVADAEGAEGEDVKNLVPSQRGWFASSTLGDLDVSGIVLWGGLNSNNEREKDGWILRID